MVVINYGYDPVFNVQLIECLLALKRNLIQVNLQLNHYFKKFSIN